MTFFISFLNFPDWKCISLTFPWPGKFFIFQNFFPDHGNPEQCRPWWNAAFCSISSRSSMFTKVCICLFVFPVNNFLSCRDYFLSSLVEPYLAEDKWSSLRTQCSVPGEFWTHDPSTLSLILYHWATMQCPQWVFNPWPFNLKSNTPSLSHNAVSPVSFEPMTLQPQV